MQGFVFGDAIRTIYDLQLGQFSDDDTLNPPKKIVIFSVPSLAFFDYYMPLYASMYFQLCLMNMGNSIEHFETVLYSYAMFLLKAIQDKCLLSGKEEDDDVAFVLFNVKGSDLLALDEEGDFETESERKETYDLYKKLGIIPMPQKPHFHQPSQLLSCLLTVCIYFLYFQSLLPLHNSSLFGVYSLFIKWK